MRKEFHPALPGVGNVSGNIWNIILSVCLFSVECMQDRNKMFSVGILHAYLKLSCLLYLPPSASAFHLLPLAYLIPKLSPAICLEPPIPICLHPSRKWLCSIKLLQSLHHPAILSQIFSTTQTLSPETIPCLSKH